MPSDPVDNKERMNFFIKKKSLWENLKPFVTFRKNFLRARILRQNALNATYTNLPVDMRARVLF